jgi:hypothetical protein
MVYFTSLDALVAGFTAVVDEKYVGRLAGPLWTATLRRDVVGGLRLSVY